LATRWAIETYTQTVTFVCGLVIWACGRGPPPRQTRIGLSAHRYAALRRLEQEDSMLKRQRQVTIPPAQPAPPQPRSLRPRVTDWSLAVGVGIACATGLISLISGHAEQWSIFALHGAAGLWLLLLLWGKLRRVWPRIVQPHRWDRRTMFGLLALVSVALTALSGVWWVAGGDVSLASFNLLNWHIAIGLALTVMVGLHMLARAKPLRARDLRGRRQALRFGGLILGALALWPAQQAVQQVLALPGAKRRFTGSRESGSFAGNAFPTSSWVADAPKPIDLAHWRLAVGGAVATPLVLTYHDLLALGNGPDDLDELAALLDCTGGFYSTQRWRGIRVGRALERAHPLPDTQYISFVAVTGYRWSLPLAEARQAVLATHIDAEPLSHAHGAPLRLVAPGRRGFEWVKWITRIEALTEPDAGQILAIHTSSFTPEGRGEK
jgi:DMSO/TMAO reductase YedYZ molybdopterin-dependent catalytic subunit